MLNLEWSRVKIQTRNYAVDNKFFHNLLIIALVTGEKMLNTFCPGRGSNQDLLRGSQTLYRVAIKAGLYRKAVQVCIIPNITTYSPPFQIRPRISIRHSTNLFSTRMCSEPSDGLFYVGRQM